MNKIVILGAGTGGTIMANRLYKSLSKKDWEITIIDNDPIHYYQPGFLFIPFGTYKKEDVVKPKADFIPKGVKFVLNKIDRVDPKTNNIFLDSGNVISYDYLIITTGTHIKPDETPGLMDSLWRKKIFDFYTLEGSLALHEFFKTWQGGTLVSSIAEMPFKCPVAPLEFVFLADEYFTKRGIRDKVKIIYTTPLSGAFTKPKSTLILGDLLKEKNIEVVTDFYIERIDNDSQTIHSFDGREVKFDVLSFVPVNMGSDYIAKSGLGDDLNYIPTNKFTLQSDQFENIFVLGDTSNIPTSKAGAVVHFASEILTENMLSIFRGEAPKAQFDGHANCFIETGFGKAALIDFNYDVEPLRGAFPIPVFGPMKLLKPTRINHFGKLAFRWIYWNILLKGRDLPVSTNMSMKGKIVD
ncbi:MAG: NAD(P)/FAD-dependent oxidoreductase [Bacteroidales bacterium]|nr:NAD(P)/FAD-dependent oxidoreductase [Bacteroidales bacterium]